MNMKKLIAVILALCTALMLFACAKEPPPAVTDPTSTKESTTSATTPAQTTASSTTQATEITTSTTTENTTTETTSETESTTAKVDPPIPATPSKMYHSADTPFAESPTHLLFFKDYVLYSYNKETGEDQIVCPDPECKHSSAPCFARRFVYASAITDIQSIRYSAYDDRFYATHGDQIYSFDEKGEELTKVLSLGWEGNLTGREPIGYMGRLSSFNIHERYLFFWKKHETLDKTELMRYDLATKTLKTLPIDKKQYSLYDYLICGDNLVFVTPDRTCSFYISDLDGKNFRILNSELSRDQNYIRQFHLADDRYIYFSYVNYNGGGGFYMLDVKTGALLEYADELMGSPIFLAADADYLYYRDITDITLQSNPPTIKGEPLLVNRGSKVYRYNKNTGKSELIWESLRYEIYELYFMGDKAIGRAKMFFPATVDSHASTVNGVAFIAKVDENGMMKDLRALEVRTVSSDYE